MEVKELKTAWDENLERCYALYRIDGKTIRIRWTSGERIIAEIFSAYLRWEPITLLRIGPENPMDLNNPVIAELIGEVKLILGNDDI
jgi:hypothetical protein